MRVTLPHVTLPHVGAVAVTAQRVAAVTVAAQRVAAVTVAAVGHSRESEAREISVSGEPSGTTDSVAGALGGRLNPSIQRVTFALSATPREGALPLVKALCGESHGVAAGGPSGTARLTSRPRPSARRAGPRPPAGRRAADALRSATRAPLSRRWGIVTRWSRE